MASSSPIRKQVNPWLVMISLMFGLFMALLDVTIVNIALPDIQAKLNTDLATVSWALNAYNLGFAVLLVTMGRFADIFGRKLIFMIGMVLFSVGSLLCALSPSVEWLIGFRALQAMGAAALNPVSLAIILAVFPYERRGAAIGIWGAMSGLASAVGPLLGGFLVQTFDWRSIFFVNLPFCVIGLIMVALFVPNLKDEQASRRIDFLGLVTLSVTLFCLVLGIIQGNSWGWLSAPVLGLFAGSVVALALFVFVELRQKEPIVDVTLFKIRSFVASNLAMFLFGIAVQGAFLILVLYFENALGYDALHAAYATIPAPLAAFVISALTGRFGRQIGPKLLGIIGLTGLAIGLGLLCTLSLDSTPFDTTWRGVILGASIGLCFTSFPNLSLAEVPRDKLGVGSGVFNTFRQVGFTLGVAILISLFSGQVKPNIDQARSNSVAIVQADTKLPPPLKSGIVAGLQKAQSNTTAGEGGSSNTAQQFNLPGLADRIPNGQSLKPELANLQTQISNEFKLALVNAFKFTWVVSAIVALLGLIPAFVTRAAKRKDAS